MRLKLNKMLNLQSNHYWPSLLPLFLPSLLLSFCSSFGFSSAVSCFFSFSFSLSSLFSLCLWGLPSFWSLLFLKSFLASVALTSKLSWILLTNYSPNLAASILLVSESTLTWIKGEIPCRFWFLIPWGPNPIFFTFLLPGLWVRFLWQVPSGFS